MKKIKLIKYDEFYLYATDDCVSVKGSAAEIQTMLTGVVASMKQQGMSEEDIMLAVNTGLKGKEYLIAEVEKLFRKNFKDFFKTEEEQSKKTTKKEGKK